MTRLIIVAIAALPASRLKNAALRWFGYGIGRTARIGPCIWLNVDKFEIGDGAVIGPFNVFRDLRLVKLGDDSRIGQWNWISAARPLGEAGAPCSLELGQGSAITSRHYLDSTGGIRFGSLSTLAGVRSTLITHAIDTERSEQTFAAIDVRDYCLLSSNITVAAPVTVGHGAMVAMNSTLPARSDLKGGMLYAGVPVKPKKRVTGDYFSRDKGPVRNPSKLREP